MLRDGGSAIEAMERGSGHHCRGLSPYEWPGGDGFWLIVPPAAVELIAIDASGAAGSHACRLWRSRRTSSTAAPVQLGPWRVPSAAGRSALAVSVTLTGNAPCR
ncbi:hypothetical protein KIF59_20210 [Enterobacter cloacae subsp. cloacae]|nr:hypothetical protein [Enterobacter cloacae subsp. cloacae]